MITLSIEPGARVRRVAFETPVYKIMLVQDSAITAEPDIRDPTDAVKILTKYLRGVDREHFVGLYLNTANRLLGIHTVSIGTLNSSLVHPREVFKPAYLMGAASLIVSHNHPSGCVEPSGEDLAITKQLVEAGKILGIPLNDHIIVTEHGGYTSFAERGLL
ncbi:MAG: DNA repair protein RadC [Deltaproteobacteria bacterium]|nr:MAG: DNA repair protein RadC [Deltaproteobacteria bacterium]